MTLRIGFALCVLLASGAARSEVLYARPDGTAASDAYRWADRVVTGSTPLAEAIEIARSEVLYARPDGTAASDDYRWADKVVTGNIPLAEAIEIAKAADGSRTLEIRLLHRADMRETTYSLRLGSIGPPSGGTAHRAAGSQSAARRRGRERVGALSRPSSGSGLCGNVVRPQRLRLVRRWDSAPLRHAPGSARLFGARIGGARSGAGSRYTASARLPGDLGLSFRRNHEHGIPRLLACCRWELRVL